MERYLLLFSSSLLAFLLGCERGPKPADPPASASPSSGYAADESIEADEVEDEAEEEKALQPTGILQREPNVPDPMEGEFGLDRALEGLPSEGDLVAEIRTNKGTIWCDLLSDEAPHTVANFVGLARGQRPWWDPRKGAWVEERYYDGTTFHRVVPGFMIQGGDVLGDGSGSIGYIFDDEVSAGLVHDRAGLLCMANRGPNTNAAQFFITDGAAAHLTAMKSFSIFGRCRPLEVITKIARVPQSGAPQNRPRAPVKINRIRIDRVAGGAAAAMSATEP